MKNTPHAYAHILHAIADGQAVQWRNRHGEWEVQATSLTITEIGDEDFEPERYRVKPSIVSINGFEVTMPFTVPPEFGTEYWYLHPNYDDGIDHYEWDGGSTDLMLLAAGMCWLKKEDALAAVAALKAVFKGETK